MTIVTNALLFLIFLAIIPPHAVKKIFGLLLILAILGVGMFVLLFTLVPAHASAGFDCYDGKHDDCTAEWSSAHKPTDANVRRLKAIIAKETAAYHACRGGFDEAAEAACALKDSLESKLDASGCIFTPTPTEAHGGGFYTCKGVRIIP